MFTSVSHLFSLQQSLTLDTTIFYSLCVKQNTVLVGIWGPEAGF